MSWKYKITILYLGFVGMMVFMVVMAIQQDFYLVREDYYEADLSYEEKYQRTQNALSLSGDLEIEYDGSSKLTIYLPSELAEKELEGQIHLYKPNDANLDQKTDISGVTGESLVFNVGELQSGLWEIRLDVDTDEEGFYFQKEFSI